MELIEARNAHAGLEVLRLRLVADQPAISGPLTLVSHRPLERVVSWPGLTPNPAQGLTDALGSLMQARPLIDPVAASLAKLEAGFHLTTHSLVVRFYLDDEAHLCLYALSSEERLMQGVFGQIGLELSLLLEMVAAAAGAYVGRMTMTQTGAILTDEQFEKLTGPSAGNLYPVNVPNRIGAESFDQLWSDLTMFFEEQDRATGWQTRFVRQTLLPIYQCASTANDDRVAAQGMTKRIIADDWREAMNRHLA